MGEVMRTRIEDRLVSEIGALGASLKPLVAGARCSDSLVATAIHQEARSQAYRPLLTCGLSGLASGFDVCGLVCRDLAPVLAAIARDGLQALNRDVPCRILPVEACVAELLDLLVAGLPAIIHHVTV